MDHTVRNGVPMLLGKLLHDENIVINEAYVKGYYSPSLCVFGIVWDGLFSDEEYIKFFVHVLEFASNNTVNGVYSDVRRQGKVSPDARDYLKKNISPTGDKLIKKVAVLVDGSPFKLFYLNALSKFDGHRAKIFSNGEEAMNYLLNAH